LREIREAESGNSKDSETKKPRVRPATKKELAFVERYKEYTKRNELEKWESQKN